VLRCLDIVVASLGLVLGLPILVSLYLLGLFDTGSPLFFQTRVGQFQRPFTLVKFRTMKPSAASVATHLADPNAVTKLGTVLRKTKLDELPQLWNVLRGDMSLVGPRPCLFNQTDLIAERAARKVFDIRPGITGLAQIQGIDMSTPVRLAETDAKLIANLTVSTYLKYIVATIVGAGSGDRIRSK
jgi:O-antigen biosynthesis protein WbqP